MERPEFMNPSERLYAELRKYAVESRATLSDRDIDRAITATVSEFVRTQFGHIMKGDCWEELIKRQRESFLNVQK